MLHAAFGAYYSCIGSEFLSTLSDLTAMLTPSAVCRRVIPSPNRNSFHDVDHPVHACLAVCFGLKPARLIETFSASRLPASAATRAETKVLAHPQTRAVSWPHVSLVSPGVEPWGCRQSPAWQQQRLRQSSSSSARQCAANSSAPFVVDAL